MQLVDAVAEILSWEKTQEFFDEWYKIFVNEIIPRQKKFGYYPNTGFGTVLVWLKIKGKLTHHELRQVLDWYYAQPKS
jgi:hypothetical protein